MLQVGPKMRSRDSEGFGRIGTPKPYLEVHGTYLSPTRSPISALIWLQVQLKGKAIIGS